MSLPGYPQALWELALRNRAHFREPAKRFVEGWSEVINQHGAAAVVDSRQLRRLIAQREQAFKGPRARVSNPNRLDQWRGGAGLGRLDYRWPNVRQLLVDLHQGLAG